MSNKNKADLLWFSDDLSVIPGMGPEDKVEVINPASENPGTIPGLDLDSGEDKNKAIVKKVVFRFISIFKNFVIMFCCCSLYLLLCAILYFKYIYHRA